MHDCLAIALSKRHQRSGYVCENRNGVVGRGHSAPLAQVASEIAFCPRHHEHTLSTPLPLAPERKNVGQAAHIAPDVKLSRGLAVQRHELERRLRTVRSCGGAHFTKASLTKGVANAPLIVAKPNDCPSGNRHEIRSDPLICFSTLAYQMDKRDAPCTLRGARGAHVVQPTIDTGGAPIPLLEPMTDIEDELRSQLLVSTVDKVFGWARRSSLWPAMFGLACCAIEMIATANARYDLARFGAEVFRASPRQADLMIVAGTVTWKMAPPVRRIYLQMAEPKWVISMGSCSNIGGPFAHGYSTLPGVNNVVPVDVYVPGCPPRPESLLAGLMLLQQVIEEEHANGHRKRRPEPTGDFSRMLPEGDPIRAELESLFPPFLSVDGQPRHRSGALTHDENYFSSR